MRRLSHYLLWAVVSILVLGMAPAALAKIIYVSPAGNDLHDGSSWARAKRTVTAALDVAATSDEIWVRYGLYYERITLKSDVSLYGGFRGTERSLSERPPFPRPASDPFESVLDGQSSGTVVFPPSSATRPYRLDGFTVRNGSASYGGGLHLSGSSASLLTVENCNISGNSASIGGGGVYCWDSSPTFTNCTISGNSSRELGGGVFCSGSSPTFTNCTLSGNSTIGNGGGVYCDRNSNPTFTNCTISGNSASGGGGVNCYSSSPTFTNCTISDNRLGGVICSYSSSPTFTNCTISDNWLSGVNCYSSSPTFTNCTISGLQHSVFRRWGVLL